MGSSWSLIYRPSLVLLEMVMLARSYVLRKVVHPGVQSTPGCTGVHIATEADEVALSQHGTGCLCKVKRLIWEVRLVELLRGPEARQREEGLNFIGIPMSSISS